MGWHDMGGKELDRMIKIIKGPPKPGSVRIHNEREHWEYSPSGKIRVTIDSPRFPIREKPKRQSFLNKCWIMVKAIFKMMTK